jgi:hypothetical protein
MARDESWERAVLKAYYVAARGCANNDWIYKRVGDLKRVGRGRYCLTDTGKTCAVI